jgi:hypothetical protein
MFVHKILTESLQKEIAEKLPFHFFDIKAKKNINLIENYMKFIKNTFFLLVVLTICVNCASEEKGNSSPLISQENPISTKTTTSNPLQLLDEEEQQDVDQSKKKKNQLSAQTPDKKATTDESTNTLSSKELALLLRAQTETYQINPLKDTLISCPKGTIMFLPANSLELPNGKSPTNSIELKIKECYQISEFIGDHLSTLTTDGDLLESGGMVNISAWSNGNELKMKKGSEFALYFPKKSKENNMQLFYGNPRIDGIVDWKLARQTADVQNGSSVVVNGTQVNYPFRQDFSSIWKPSIDMYYNKEKKILNDLRFKESDQNLTNYFHQKFSVSQDIFVSLRAQPRIGIAFEVDKSGNLKNIVYEKTGIQEFDSLMLDFFNTLPKLDVSKIKKYRKSKQYQMVIGKYWYGSRDYDLEYYEKNIEDKYASFKDQAITKIDQSELNYYVLAASSFGWINCDRFYQTPEKKLDYVVNVKDKIGDMKIVIVFKEMNSIMQGYHQAGQTKFAKIPINQPIKIIGISYENEKPMLAIAETITSEQGFELTDFKEFTLDELKSQLGN